MRFLNLKSENLLALKNIRALLKPHTNAIISFCHPKYDFLPEGLTTKRIAPKGATYESEFKYEKIIKENGAAFYDYHRPIEYYESLFKENGFLMVDIFESEILGTAFPPDFILYGLALQ